MDPEDNSPLVYVTYSKMVARDDQWCNVRKLCAVWDQDPTALCRMRKTDAALMSSSSAISRVVMPSASN